MYIQGKIMKRYFLNFSYIGSNYRGSQKHSANGILDVDSIQGTLENSLWRLNPILSQPPKVVLAGRTDAGVHALRMSAHIDLEHHSGTTNFDKNNLIKMMNRHLISTNHEIRILSCHEVNKDFHARFSAKSRTYMYRFLVAKDLNDKRVPIAEYGRTMHFQTKDFDIERLKSGIKLFQGTRDFRTFTNKGILDNKKFGDEYNPSFVKTLNVSLHQTTPLMPFDPLSDNFDFWYLTYKSKSFLYNQVRRITGTLLALAAGRISENTIKTMLLVPSHDNWCKNVAPAQAHGLYLANVEYDEADICEVTTEDQSV